MHKIDETYTCHKIRLHNIHIYSVILSIIIIYRYCKSIKKPKIIIIYSIESFTVFTLSHYGTTRIASQCIPIN